MLLTLLSGACKSIVEQATRETAKLYALKMSGQSLASLKNGGQFPTPTSENGYGPTQVAAVDAQSEATLVGPPLIRVTLVKRDLIVLDVSTEPEVGGKLKERSALIRRRCSNSWRELGGAKGGRGQSSSITVGRWT